MTSAWSQLEQMLTCAICLDKFKNPRLLPCQHSFCGDACMEGLVDYARRQIKCPECRAEHRIPYQGVTSLPSNVTLIRFLELHSRITGEEPEPVPKFMEKCSVCSEKVDGVQRCGHCEKKVCPECKEAHIDLLKRELNRVNGQIKRCLSKIKEFKDSVKKNQDKLTVNHVSVRHEIEESCRRLFEDLKSKQEKLLNEADSYANQESKLLEQLDASLTTELDLLESNIKVCDDNINAQNYAWTDLELVEMKDIYVKALEFVRLFDPDLGDFTRKMRFQMVPEFDTMRKRICELGELKFADTSVSLLVASLQFCGASGPMAVKLTMAQQQLGANGQNTNYSLAHSSSNSSQMNALSTSATNAMLQLPSMQNSLMRSQSDHRLAQQFQQRLKQQEAGGGATTNSYGFDNSSSTVGSRTGYSSRYGSSNASSALNDPFEQSMRSRYGPGARGSNTGTSRGLDSSQQSDRDLERLQLTRDWPRPSDSSIGNELSSSDLPFSSSIHFKSAFMRRKEKERQSAYGTNNGMDDDDDNDSTITSASSAYKVRFNQQNDNELSQLAGGGLLSQQANGGGRLANRVFDCEEVERGPYSGVIRLGESPYLLERLYQLEAKLKVDKKQEEAEAAVRTTSTAPAAGFGAVTRQDSRTPINYSRQLSEDEIEKQKSANKLAASLSNSGTDTISSAINTTTTTTTIATNDSNNNSREQSLEQNISSNERYGTNTSTTNNDIEPRPAPRLRSRGAPNQTVASSDSLTNNQSLNSFDRSDIHAATTTTTTPDAPNSGNSTPTGTRTPTSMTPTRQKLSGALMGTSRQVSDVDNGNAGVSSGGSSSGTSSTRTRKNLRSLGRSTSSKQSSNSNVTGQQQQTDVSGLASAAATRQRRRLRLQESSRSQDQSSLDIADMSRSDLITSVSANRAAGSSLSSDADGGNRITAAKQQNSSMSTTMDNPSSSLDKNSKNYLAGSGGSNRYRTRQQQQPNSRASNDRISSDHTTTTTDDDDDDDDDDDSKSDSYSIDDNSITRNRSRTLTASTATIKALTSKAKTGKATGDADTDDGNSEEDDDDLSVGSSSLRGTPTSKQSQKKEILPNAVSLLLDRSAQIRKDSLEQRNRADSPGPQGSAGRRHNTTSSSVTGITTTATSSIVPTTATTLQQQTTSTSSGASSPSTTGGGGRNAIDSSSSLSQYRSAMSSSSSAPMTARQRLAYRRSQSIHSNSQDQHGDLHHHHQQQQVDSQQQALSNNSTNSVYSTASSGGFRSSFEDAPMASPSSSSTLNKTLASSSMPYQSRFLSRSRTSAALAQASTSGQASNRSQLDNNNISSINSSLDNGESSDYSTSARSTASYLSGRDRGTASGAYRSSTAATSAVGSSATKRSPQIEQIDDMSLFEGMKTHSEYLRNKFSASRKASQGSGSTCSAALLRSRSSHAMFGRSNSDSNSDTPAGISDVDDNDASISSGGHNNNPYLSGGSSTTKRGSFGLTSTNSIGSTVGYGLGTSSSSNNNRDQESTTLLDRCVYSGKKRMLFKLGSRGSDPGHLTWPRGVAITGNDQIVVADSSNHRVQLFDANGRFLSQFGSYGSAPGEFDCLAGIAVNRIRQYIVSDRYNHRIQVFDPSGRFMRAFGTIGRSDGKFNLPWGVACDNSGLIYVCDKENHRVQVFDINGSNVNKFGQCGNGPGQLQHPHYIALGQGKVVVTDTNNHRVQIFDLGGRLITLFGQEGSANGQFKFPRGVAMDDQGYIIVGDSGNNRLQIFNSEGVFVKSLGTWGSAEGEFKGIEGVAVNSSYNILVCDRENHRIQVF